MVRLWAGRLLMALRLPGIMVAQTYEAEITRARVRVHLSPLFSVVSVNGVDIYFHRLTGRIDGVGFSASTGYKADEIR
jgi:hypothetical protein